MPTPIEDLGASAGTIAAWMGAAGLAALTVWRAILGIRRDTRTDHAESRELHSADSVNRIWRDITDKLHGRLEALEADFGEERAARLHAEEAHTDCERKHRIMEKAVEDCERRSNALERRVAFLESKGNGR